MVNLAITHNFPKHTKWLYLKVVIALYLEGHNSLSILFEISKVDFFFVVPALAFQSALGKMQKMPEKS